MKKTAAISLAATAIVLASAGGGWAWALHEGRAELDVAVARVRAQIGPNGSLTYASSSVNPLSRSADLSGVAMRLPSGSLVTADAVHLVAGDGDGRIAALRVTGMRASGAATDGAISAAFLDASGIAVPPGAAERKVDPADVTVASATFRGLSYAAMGTSVQADGFRLSDYGSGHRSTLSVTALSVAVPSTEHVDHVALGRIEVDGLDLATLVNAAERNLPPPAISSGGVRFALAGLHVSNQGEDVLSAASAELSATAAANGASSDGRMELSGVLVRPVDDTTRREFAEAGLSELSLDASVPTSYAVAGGRLRGSPSIRVAGLGTLSLAVEMAHVDLTAFQGGNFDPAEMARVGSQAQIVSLEAHYADSGLLGRLLEATARRYGTSKDQVRAAAVQALQADRILDALPHGAEIKASLASFVSDGGSLVVGIHPKEPISLAEVDASADNPEATLAGMGLTVTRASPRSAGAGGAVPD
jgi:hypothetical protein